MASWIAVVVGFVSPDRILVPLGGKQALATDRLEALANTADTGKQIDEGTVLTWTRWIPLLAPR